MFPWCVAMLRNSPPIPGVEKVVTFEKELPVGLVALTRRE